MTEIADSADHLRAVGQEHTDGLSMMAQAAGVDAEEIRQWSDAEAVKVMRGIAGSDNLAELNLPSLLLAIANTALSIGFVHGAYFKGQDDG